MTLSELVAQATQQLTDAKVSFGHGTSNARDEAAWLVLHALGLPLDTPLGSDDLESNRPVTPEEYARTAALLGARISTRKPAAYLTNEAWLQGVPFYVDERVIVPRSLIAELLVDGGIDYWLQESTHRVLDLCTGNGSLGILAAMVYPDVEVTGADISADALAVARINVDKHSLQARVQLVESDGLSALPGPFDLILCNPPYVNAQSMAELPAEYLAEPFIALDGNQAGGSGDGMDFIRTLLKQAPAVMAPNAVLVLEIGNERAFFEAAFPELEVVWLETSAGEDQVLLVTKEALLL
ncbi:MAG: ribosomal protein L3 N(5)-glutamine methyltransferase [Curvibacter sp. RIFCSPHIGHO2_12_FULL_63_18]|uniref:50S ribosomal protein L3 N(5)-glutamine methyltransferase n=1 Tax=Rhodoferax sp. TaxID=50421 RepID=UPI0008B3B5D6|nr:50S ribosomal protein L3 N(5)-glutamine methyltransferase [Rhodoferax sp.]OGO96946.1 MAG: ribosomal protein L3 N(5)-glutamine methyltransferase [Curvibacter sp. GWA2_63_95]OGP01122.1 MAG: ribosomal protein L3 N(5)-glutamine methyltransferase [Curvibacter sp. RIFCSPHIGHO2_12_FULL_63_18]HCX80710.1 50S ribosomal protein L3 N(5)-glutamine methyltransferase [Rhodoferax sp.]